MNSKHRPDQRDRRFEGSYSWPPAALAFEPVTEGVWRFTPDAVNMPHTSTPLVAWDRVMEWIEEEDLPRASHVLVNNGRESRRFSAVFLDGGIASIQSNKETRRLIWGERAFAYVCTMLRLKIRHDVLPLETAWGQSPCEEASFRRNIGCFRFLMQRLADSMVKGPAFPDFVSWFDWYRDGVPGVRAVPIEELAERRRLAKPPEPLELETQVDEPPSEPRLRILQPDRFAHQPVLEELKGSGIPLHWMCFDPSGEYLWAEDLHGLLLRWPRHSTEPDLLMEVPPAHEVMGRILQDGSILRMSHVRKEPAEIEFSRIDPGTCTSEKLLDVPLPDFSRSFIASVFNDDRHVVLRYMGLMETWSTQVVSLETGNIGEHILSTRARTGAGSAYLLDRHSSGSLINPGTGEEMKLEYPQELGQVYTYALTDARETILGLSTREGEGTALFAWNYATGQVSTYPLDRKDGNWRVTASPDSRWALIIRDLRNLAALGLYDLESGEEVLALDHPRQGDELATGLTEAGFAVEDLAGRLHRVCFVAS